LIELVWTYTHAQEQIVDGGTTDRTHVLHIHKLVTSRGHSDRNGRSEMQ